MRGVTSRGGRPGHQPVRHVPDCEVLAALAPERVLPFASGGSRKRGPGRAGAKTSAKCRGGAPKGERARRWLSPLRDGPTGRARTARQTVYAKSVNCRGRTPFGCVSRRSASLLGRSWKGFLAVAWPSSNAEASREWGRITVTLKVRAAGAPRRMLLRRRGRLLRGPLRGHLRMTEQASRRRTICTRANEAFLAA